MLGTGGDVLLVRRAVRVAGVQGAEGRPVTGRHVAPRPRPGIAVPLACAAGFSAALAAALTWRQEGPVIMAVAGCAVLAAILRMAWLDWRRR